MKELMKLSVYSLLVAFLWATGASAHQNPQDEPTQALTYKKLQEYLPGSLDGYVRGEPDGETVTMQNMSFSSASVEFTDDNGEYVHITLVDYMMAVSMYEMATAMWATGLKVESDEMVAGMVQFDDHIAGWEELDKENREASLVLGIGHRFLLTIEASEQDDTDLVKKIARSMNLDDLAE